MLEGPEDQIDLALANWLIASDLPEFQDMTCEEYFELQSEAESRVRYMIDKARGDPAMAGDMSDPERLAYVFCSAHVFGLKSQGMSVITGEIYTTLICLRRTIGISLFAIDTQPDALKRNAANRPGFKGSANLLGGFNHGFPIQNRHCQSHHNLLFHIAAGITWTPIR